MNSEFLLRTDPTGQYRCANGGTCPWCEGIHYGQTVCAYSPNRMVESRREQPAPVSKQRGICDSIDPMHHSKTDVPHERTERCVNFREPAPGEPTQCATCGQSVDATVHKVETYRRVPGGYGHPFTSSQPSAGEKPPDEREIIRRAIWLLENVEGAATADCYKKDSTDWAEWCAVRDKWLEVTNAYR